MVNPFDGWYKFLVLALSISLSYGYAKASYSRAYQTFLFFAVLYPWGKIFQAFHLGPQVVRWYVADMGFIAGISYFYAITSGLVGARAPYRSRLTTGIWIGFVIASTTEYVQLATNDLVVSMSRGDWTDMGVFILTAVGLALLVDRMPMGLRPPSFFQTR